MKLTDKDKKAIIADYVECQNYSAVARRHNVSRTTVKNVVDADSETCEKLHEKKAENTQAVLEHMESLVPQVNDTIDKLLDALGDEAKIKRAGLMQVATTLGIVIDKFTQTSDEHTAEDKVADKLNDIFGGLSNAD